MDITDRLKDLAKILKDEKMPGYNLIEETIDVIHIMRKREEEILNSWHEERNYYLCRSKTDV